MDPLAEKGYQQSPYNYVFNNPIGFVDPDGKFRTRIGAWLYKVFSGGDEIHEHEESGQYYVTKDNVSNEDGTNTITSTVRYNWSGGNEPTLYDQNGGIKIYGKGGGETKTTARNPDEESIENSGIPSFQPERFRRSENMGMIVAELVMRIAGIFQANNDNKNEDINSSESDVSTPDETDKNGNDNDNMHVPTDTVFHGRRKWPGYLIYQGDSVWYEIVRNNGDTIRYPKRKRGDR